MRAAITGRLVITLTVTDLPASAAWYGRLLSAEENRNIDPQGILRQVILIEPNSGLELCLVSYPAHPAVPFSEFRTGLDHLEFLVATREELDHWAVRLDELGIVHSGVKELGYTANRMITFRDPDNIQLELFWPAPHPSPSPDDR
jgi:catechol 2,3-dioxygenase-like lactoylglutathione lyase family enzyme